MARLRDEPALLALAQKAHDYFARTGDTKQQSKVRGPRGLLHELPLLTRASREG
jgi:hypothetical protein